MNFELTEDQQLIKDMVKDFSSKEIMPKAKALEDNSEFPKDLFNKLAELGILGMTVSTEYEGTEADRLSFLLAIEEISRFFPSLGVILSVHSGLFCYSILKYGSKQQKDRYLPDSVKGKLVGAFSLSEPGAGSDAMNLKTKAKKVDNHYLLNGIKAWVTNGAVADAFIVFAKTESDMAKKKISAFIVEKNFPGFSVSKVEEKMGLHASQTAEITLEDCKVPVDNLLGEEGNGAKIAFKCLDSSRLGIAAQSNGISAQAIREAIKFSKQREAFNKTISEFQAIQFKIADISVLLDASRLLTYRAADLDDKGKPFSKEAAIAKLFASEVANKIVYESLQIHGGYGYSSEFLIEQLYRDARVLSIYEGTSEIQRLIIARNILKD